MDQRFDAPRLRRPTVAIEMVKGTLTISTTLVATREPIVVEEGQCLMVRDQCVPMAAESFMDCLYADECPYNLITAEIVQTGTPAADHGTAVVAERATAECGETRTVTVTPDEDYRISELRIDPLQDVEDEARAMPYTVDLSQVQICNDEGLPPIQTENVFEVCRLADNCAAILVTFPNIREDHLVEVTFDNGPIYGTSGADKLFGTACPDTIVGLAGDDHIDGGFAGPDTMQGGAGNDTYRVDEAGDVVTELASEGTDTVTASIDYTLGANVENLTGTGSEDLILTGNDMANQIYGSSGNDLIYGSSGDDVLWGRGGDNTIYCGPGNDTVYAREENDTIHDCETVLEPPYDTSGAYASYESAGRWVYIWQTPPCAPLANYVTFCEDRGLSWWAPVDQADAQKLVTFAGDLINQPLWVQVYGLVSEINVSTLNGFPVTVDSPGCSHSSSSGWTAFRRGGCSFCDSDLYGTSCCWDYGNANDWLVCML